MSWGSRRPRLRGCNAPGLTPGGGEPLPLQVAAARHCHYESQSWRSAQRACATLRLSERKHESEQGQ